MENNIPNFQTGPTGEDLNKLFGRLREPFALPYPEGTLSVVMIVKDEARNIEAAVNSFLPFADEIIINDTGSTDGTQKILDQLPVKWFQTQWQNDFSLARNQSIERASCAWLLWMDADDRVPSDQVENFRKLKSAPLDRIFGFQIINTQAGLPRGARFMQLRMFPNHPEIRFERKIHEQMVFSAARLGVHCFYLDTVIHHTGYEDEEVKKSKARRNLALAEGEKHLLGVDPTYTMSLGDSRYILGEWQKGIDIYKKAWAIPGLKEINKDVHQILPTFIGIGYKKLGTFEEAHSWFDKALSLSPDSMEPYFHKAEMFHLAGHASQAEPLFRKVLAMPLVHSSTGNQYDIFRMFSYHHLSDILEKSGRHEENLNILNGMRKDYPEIIELWYKLGKCHRALGQKQKALESWTEGARRNPGAIKNMLADILLLAQELGDTGTTTEFLALAKKHFPQEDWTAYATLAGPNFSPGTTQPKEAGAAPLLSVCMIVKNEAQNLPRCLESIRNLRADLVVVDTGSKDNTVALAQSFGARISHFTWIHDFAAARNHSLGQARGKWILWLDADDEISPDNLEKIQSLLNLAGEGNIPPKAYGFLIKNSDDGGISGSVFNQIRLFPNRADLRFSSPVHEQVLPAIEKAGLPVEYTPIQIFHRGYADPEIAKGKQLRNIEILEAQVKEGRNITAVTLYTLAHAYFDLGDNDNAIEYFIQAVEKAEQTGTNPHIIEAVPPKVAAALANLGKFAEARNVLQGPLASAAPPAEAFLIQGQIAAALHQSAEAHHWFSLLLELEEKPSFIPVDVVMLKIKAGEFLGNYWFSQNQKELAAEILKRTLALKSGSPFTLQEYLTLLQKYGQMAPAAP